MLKDKPSIAPCGGKLAQLTMILSLAFGVMGCPNSTQQFEETRVVDNQKEEFEELISEAKVVISAFQKNILSRELALIQIQVICDKLGEIIQEDVSDEEVTQMRIHHTGLTILSSRDELRDGIAELFSDIQE